MYYDRPKKRSEKKAAKKPGRPARVPSRSARRPKSARSVKKRAPAGCSSRVVSAPRRKRHLLLKGFVALILLVLLGAVGLYFLPVASLGSQKAPGAFQSLPKGYTHVLLIGLDTNSYDTSNNALQTDPAFVDAANGNFTPTGADQVARKTGDPRWWPASE